MPRTAPRPRYLSTRERRNAVQARCGVASIIFTALAFVLIVAAASAPVASATVVGLLGACGTVAFMASIVCLIHGADAR